MPTAKMLICYLKGASMKSWKVVLLLGFVFGLLLAACAEDVSPPTPEPDPVVDVTEVLEPTPEPEPTDSPTATAVSDPTVAPEPTAEPEPELPDDFAHIVNDEGGPVSITGVVSYTNPLFGFGVAAPVVILEDQTGFVDRDKDYIFPVESQTLGQITSDFYTSPFSYSVALPLQPLGAFRDVDHDGEDEQGIQVFAVAYWNNVFGDPFLEERDLGGGGWSTAYASTRVSDNPETEREIVGGYFLAYSPDGLQGFPSGFGEDGLLFTDDDPIVTLPQGYTLVNLDTDPFTFDRSRHPIVNLIEPEGAALVDYSEQSYTEAFDGLVDQLINEYAFTEYKGIDWETLRTQFRPEMVQADADGDAERYLRALRDFVWSIPDGHVSGPFLGDEFRANILGGIGMAIRELEGDRILINFLLDGGPADGAGIELRAEIIAMNGVPVTDWVTQTTAWSAPFSTPHTERLDKLLFATRFPVGAVVEVTYQNMGGSVQTAVLTATRELDSYFFWLENDDRDGFELPVEYELLDEGIGYVQILSFSDNDLLTVQLWERMIRAMKDEEIPAIILDMRKNGGGLGSLADNMSAYFFQESLLLGNASYYDRERGEFYTDPDYEDVLLLPPEDFRYNGRIVVLVGPDCASACEFFSFNMTLNDRATIIGHYPTAGLGGSIDRVALPEDEEFTFTQGRSVGPDGEIHIEGIGVVPDIRIPVTEENLFDREDAVLEAAIAFLVGVQIDGGDIRVGDVVEGSINPGERVLYRLNLSAGDFFSMVIESQTAGQNLILSVFDESNNLLGATEPDMIAGFVEIEMDEDIVFVLEISTEDNAGTADYTLTIEDNSE
jgi:C-terminal processing protease CtpA/Prc